MRVILSGRLKQRSYETKEGEKRTVFEVEVDEVGPSLRNATAKVTRAQRAGGTGGGFAAPAATGGESFNDDPWAAASTTSAGGGWATTTSEEPPF
jgi:single-strand DNA-binding protein